MLVGYLSPYMSPSCLGRRAPGMGITHFVRAFRDWQRVGCLRVDFSEHLWKSPSGTWPVGRGGPRAEAAVGEDDSEKEGSPS